MPPAAIALISEPSITFQPTEASIFAIASRISIVSVMLASSPPSSFGIAMRKIPASTSASTVSCGRRLSCCARSPPSRITSESRAMRSSGVPITAGALVLAGKSKLAIACSCAPAGGRNE